MTGTGSAPAGRSQPAAHSSPAAQTRYVYSAIALVILFLVSIARLYHPDTGFTSLIAFPEHNDREAAALGDIPHHVYPRSASYDGQFYAQRALDPLLRDPQVDAAMDSPPFRARRILFSWTAYLLGLGRPAWIIQAYALQNVLCWLVLAVLLRRWIPLTSLGGLALWSACLFSHGMIWSVRLALLDGPSLLLIALAILAVERGRPLASAAVVGLAALGRETNVLALLAQPVGHGGRRIPRLVAALLLALVPLALWYDYLRSIYRSTLLTGADSFVLPGAGLLPVWQRALSGVLQAGLLSNAMLAACLLISLAAQALFLAFRRTPASPWWRIAVGYAAMMLLLHPNLVEPRTGAITRVLLPMTVAFNILLGGQPRPPGFWTWFAAGNLHVIAAVRLLPLFPF